MLRCMSEKISIKIYCSLKYIIFMNYDSFFLIKLAKFSSTRAYVCFLISKRIKLNKNLHKFHNIRILYIDCEV